MDGDPGRETESTERRSETPMTDERPERSDSRAADERPERPDRGRRRLLAAAGGAGAALLAGCSGLLPGDDSIDVTASEAGDADTATATPPSEVNVVGLQYDRDGSTFEFHVTLSPPAVRGADWWQIETLDGDRIARHEFDEPVTGGRFTTSSSVTVEDADAVVVRGHGVGPGYGGQVMLADLTEGFITLERQGDEPESFDGYAF